MSLKAKLEAVIYAAEEPVTLAQLAALFTADALALSAERAAASGPAADPAQPLPLVEDEFAYLDLEPAPPADPAVPEAVETAPDHPVAPAAVDDGGAEPAPESGEPLGIEPATAEAPADSEGELRRQARLRDREVRATLSGLLDELIADYASDDRGVEIRQIAGGYRMATKPECHDAVRVFVRSLKPALKLSLPALETLAVIAYKQPVTGPEVNEIRGVESNATLGSLLSRKLIATAGRKQVIGRPILYKTTREFLLKFGLKDLAELPSMEEFEKMAAIELDDSASEGSETGAEARDASSLDFSEESADDPNDAAPASAETETALTAPTPPDPAESEQTESEQAETEAFSQ